MMIIYCFRKNVVTQKIHEKHEIESFSDSKVTGVIRIIYCFGKKKVSKEFREDSGIMIIHHFGKDVATQKFHKRHELESFPVSEKKTVKRGRTKIVNGE